MKLSKLWIIACAEKRMVYKLKSYWLCLWTAYAAAILLFLYKSFEHEIFSSISLSFGTISSRDLLPYIAIFFLSIFLIPLNLCSVEIRARDSREGILDSLDTRPYSNTDLVFGKFLGIFLSIWIPVIILLLLLQILGAILYLSGVLSTGFVDPYSFFLVGIYMAIPVVSLCCSLALLVTLLLSKRFFSLLLIIALYWSAAQFITLPSNIAKSVDIFGAFQISQPSDWVSSLSRTPLWAQRIGLMFLSLGMLFFTTFLHPRLDDGNKNIFIRNGIICTFAGLALGLFTFLLQQNAVDQMKTWRSYHDANKDNSFPDIVSMQADVDINPGKELHVALQLTFKSYSSEGLESALFSLNPGFDITNATDASGNILATKHQNGLLEVLLDQPATFDQLTSIQIIYQGKPNTGFGYLDSAYDVSDETVSLHGNTIFNLDKAIFNTNYVALMPGIHWLPSSGVDTGRDDNRAREKDFYSVDLNVSVPTGWTVAGPGLRTLANTTGNNIEYEFSPQSVVPEVALMAAPFITYDTDINGITFEVLLHPKHDAIIDIANETQGEIKQWISTQLSLIQDSNLEYPYKVFSLVEVPNTLRGYKGGWRMDTALAPPTMALMKEKGFPTTSFGDNSNIVNNTALRLNINSGTSLVNKEQSEINRDKLIDYFTNDYSGGNIFSSFSRSSFSHQTAAIGKEAIALDYTISTLASLVLTEKQHYFSIYNALYIEDRLTRPRNFNSLESWANRLISTVVNRDEVFVYANSVPLYDLDPWDKPEFIIDALAIKGGQLADLIYEFLGPQQSGQLLKELRSKSYGSSFRLDDLTQNEIIKGSPLEAFINSWFNSTSSAFFTFQESEVYRLPDNENQESQFQLRMQFKNESSQVGFVRLAWNGIGEPFTFSEVISINPDTTLEYGVVLTEPPITTRVFPFPTRRQVPPAKHLDLNNISEKDLAGFEGVRVVSQ